LVLVLLELQVVQLFSSLHLEQGSAEGETAGLLLKSQQILGAVDLQTGGGDGRGAGARGRRRYRSQMERGIAEGWSYRG